ncbi:MAG: RND family transporter [Bacteroidia bacterium]
MIDRIIEWLLRNRTWLLSFLLGGTVLFIIGLSQLRLEFSFDSFFPKSDPEYQYYADYSAEFDELQDYLIAVAIHNPDGSIIDKDFLQKADLTFQELSHISGIDSSALATRVSQVKRRGLGYKLQPFLEFDTEKNLTKSVRRLRRDSLFARSFMSKDSAWLCSYYFIQEDFFDKSERDEISYSIDGIIEKSGFETQISGIPYIRTRYVEKLSGELMMFLTLSALLLMVCLALLYRTIWGVMVPLLVALVAIMWTLGLMGGTGEPITILSNLLIPVMFVVAMSDVIHIVTKYLAMTEEGMERVEALRRALQQVGMATFLTSVTTAIGFGALMVSRVHPMRMFGMYAAAGVMITFIVTVAALTYILPKLKPSQIAKPNKGLAAIGTWDRWLGKLDLWIKRHPIRIAIGGFALLFLAGYFTLNIPVNNYLLEDMHKKDPVRQAMGFFEDQFDGGIRTFELAFEAADGHEVTELAVLEQMAKVEDFLGKNGSFSPFLSPVTILKSANEAYNFNRPGFRQLPDSQAQVNELLSAIKLQGGSIFLDLVISDDKQRARLSSRIPDMGTEAFYELKNRLYGFADQNIDSSLVAIRVTGHAALTENNLEYLRTSLLEGLLIAFILVAVLMGLLFRSWKMLLVSLVPNLAPLLLTGGVMGLFGINLSSSTSIVFVVAFGIAVDDTIHFLTRFKLERARCATIDEAIRKTIIGTGKAMILTSIVLLGGFVLLLASDFGGTYNTGFFTGLTILFALFADLLLLPVLLRWVFGEKPTSTL